MASTRGPITIMAGSAESSFFAAASTWSIDEGGAALV
ncbi:hypothetical protein X759_34785 [Mesorhizobium sp. LSHC420B00]|nr:hypothetical protein X759_34785 [Mesorhizobium sp. LSHC420B00]